MTFAAGASEQSFDVWLRSVGADAVGFSDTATVGGTLTARVGTVSGYDTAKTAEVEVVVVEGPLWIASLTQPSYAFLESGGRRDGGDRGPCRVARDAGAVAGDGKLDAGLVHHRARHCDE